MSPWTLVAPVGRAVPKPCARKAIRRASDVLRVVLLDRSRVAIAAQLRPRGSNLWFTLYHGMVLGKITVNDRATLYHDLGYPSDGHNFDPVAIIVRDRAGRLVYNEGQAGRIAQVTLSLSR